MPTKKKEDPGSEKTQKYHQKHLFYHFKQLFSGKSLCNEPGCVYSIITGYCFFTPLFTK